MPDPSLLALLLRQIRGERNQPEMAVALMALLPPRDLPLTRQHVWNYETGQAKPPPDVLGAYAAMAPDSAMELLRLVGMGWAVEAIEDSNPSAA